MVIPGQLFNQHVILTRNNHLYNPNRNPFIQQYEHPFPPYLPSMIPPVNNEHYYMRPPYPATIPPASNLQTIFDNPLYPLYEDEDYKNKQNNHLSTQYQQLPTNYPPLPFGGKPPAMQTFINSFKNKDGQIDFNKMFATAGQMVNTINQVANMVKGLGSIFKV
ncbi:YppG family protein [Bacillus kwashiorkori]|uniref:YppG family protein n=1 Tax=Bacillus kwashiorkori TaxID=1522318 RepID=UPI0007842832|nr:YppG family protein [Bacillus kwashiorkori]